VSVEKLARQYLALKAERDDLQTQIDALTEELASRLEHPDEGSKTHTMDGVKVTVTSRVNRTIDERAWASIRSGVPKNLWPVKEKLTVEPKGCRYLAENHPEMWAVVAGAITEKPGKPGVKVEVVE